MDDTDLQSETKLSGLIPYFRKLFDSAEECVCICDANKNVVYVNAKLGKTLNISPSAEAFENNRVLYESIFQPFYKAIDEVIESRKSTHIFLNVPSQDSRRNINDWIYLNPIFDSENELLGILSIGRDMDLASPWKIENDQRHNIYLRALLDTFPFIVWMKDQQGRFLEVSQKFADVVGEPRPQNLFGKTDFDYWPEEMAQGYVEDDKEVLDTGLPKNVEERIQKANGDIYWAETYKSPVNIDGKTIGTVGFARDISEKQQLLAEIKQSHTDYQSLVDHLPMTVIRYNLDCKRVFVSKNCYDPVSGITIKYDLGVTPEQQWNPYITNMSGEEFTQHLREVMQSGSPYHCELDLQAGDRRFVSLVKIVPEYEGNNRVTGALTITQDITETYQYRQNIEYLAYYDGITQLPNRSHFQNELMQKLARAKSTGSPLCVMMLDLDHFKSINDELGHSVGDNMLIEVASRLRGIAVENTLLARLGGDEFAILMTNYSSTDEIIDLANEIISVMAPAFTIEERDIFISASIGIAIYPEHADTPSDLMKYADSAMYLAKKQGRNTYQFFVADINESNAFNHLLRNELRHAIQGEEFFVEYQPIFDIQQNRIIKYEALLRWNSPLLGFIGPDKFIPVAEEYGLINEVGNWVILHVCRDAVIVNQQMTDPIVFSLNLSPRQFIRNNLAEAVRTCILTSRCKASLLEFEITEGLLMDNSPEISLTLQSFDEQGITLSVDDFGTGYSSLSYLNKFPISTVKIDKSFIRDITSDEKDAALTKAIINMGVSLGKTLTAEGIETQEQLRTLKEWGCHHGQGYLLGRPRRLEFILDDIAQGRHGLSQ